MQKTTTKTILRLKSVMSRTGLSRSTIYDLMSRGEFPRPVKLTGKAVAWPESAIAAPVWHELTYGCRRLPRGKPRDAIDAYLQDVVKASFPILAYDEAAATWHGHERARLEGLGRSAPFTDGQIASIAHVNGLTLVTFNVKDFAHFKDLSVTTWTA
jgi:tRNA(fMet)-specific endonuclease VapC